MSKGTILISVMIASAAYIYVMSNETVGKFQITEDATFGTMVLNTKTGELWKSYLIDENDFGMTPMPYSYNDSHGTTPDQLWETVAMLEKNSPDDNHKIETNCPDNNVSPTKN